MEENEEILEFFKALSDANRLKIIGLLAERPLTVEQMAEMLHLRPSTVSNHLSFLARVGLVSARAESYYNIYSLKFDRLDELGRRMLSRETYPPMASEVDVDAYDRKVLADYSTPDGRLKTIPAQRKKLEVILRHIAQAFEPGRRYSEKQVNEILARYHSDTASLRRELVGYKMLERQGGGEYWREAEVNPAPKIKE
jgi:predicted transcriptional regulator